MLRWLAAPVAKYTLSAPRIAAVISSCTVKTEKACCLGVLSEESPAIKSLRQVSWKRVLVLSILGFDRNLSVRENQMFRHGFFCLAITLFTFIRSNTSFGEDDDRDSPLKFMSEVYAWYPDGTVIKVTRNPEHRHDRGCCLLASNQKADELHWSCWACFLSQANISWILTKIKSKSQ